MTIGHTIIGRGERKVLVLHGWFGDYTVFEPTFNSIDMDQFTFAFMDNRGYGKSRNLAGDHTMKEIAADAIALVDELGWQKFYLVGHSMGAMAMQRIMLDIDDPSRIRGAIAVTPVPASGVPLDEESAALFEGAISSEDNRRAILDFTTGNRNSAQWLNYMVDHCRESTTQDAYADYLAAWTKTNFVDEIKGNKTPMLVCIGEFDPAFTTEVMEQTYLSWLPESNLKVISNAGHYPMQEAPVQMATAMQEFISAH